MSICGARKSPGWQSCEKNGDDYELELKMLTESNAQGEENYARLAELRSRLCRVAEEIEQLSQVPPPAVYHRESSQNH